VEIRINSKVYGIRDSLRDGWFIYQYQFTKILLIILSINIPISIITTTIRFLVLKGQSELAISNTGIYFLTNIIITLLSFVALIPTIGIAYLVEKTIKGEKISWQRAMLYGFSRLFPAIGTSLLAFIIVWALFFLIIPGIIWAVYYSFILYVVALRQLNGKKALDYSKNLVKGQWWRVLGFFFFVGLMQFAIGFIIQRLFGLISANLFFNIIPNIIVLIINMFFVIVIIIYFLNNDYRLHPKISRETLPLDSNPSIENSNSPDQIKGDQP